MDSKAQRKEAAWEVYEDTTRKAWDLFLATVADIDRDPTPVRVPLAYCPHGNVVTVHCVDCEDTPEG